MTELICFTGTHDIGAGPQPDVILGLKAPTGKQTSAHTHGPGTASDGLTHAASREQGCESRRSHTCSALLAQPSTLVAAWGTHEGPRRRAKLAGGASLHAQGLRVEPRPYPSQKPPSTWAQVAPVRARPLRHITGTNPTHSCDQTPKGRRPGARLHPLSGRGGTSKHGTQQGSRGGVRCA